MSRNLMFVLFLATGFALAEKKPEAKHDTHSTAAQKKAVAVPEQTKAAQPVSTQEGKAEEDPQGESEPAETQGRDEATQAETEQGAKLVSVPGGKALGMSVLGNQEAPTSLVIVPWKSSEVGRANGISPMLDDSRRPVDKEVFMRELRYYEIRSEKKP